MEEGNVSVRFSFSQQQSSNSAAHFLSFPDGFVSSLHSSLAFFFYSFDFSSLDLISASPPTDPDPICAPFLLLPSSSLYSAPCGWLGNGKCWAPLYNYNQGAREHTHTHMPLFTVGASSIAEEEEVDGCAPPFSLPLFFLPQKLRQFSWGFVLEKKRAASFSLLFLFLYNISFLF
jgi:hypothetical protein